MDNLLDFTPFGLLMKARNQAIDAVFYDVSSLTFEEWLGLNPAADRKGKIIVVSPSGSGKPIRHYKSAEQFAASDDWEKVFAIAIAGVGSSAIGTAALARNIADAFKDRSLGDVAGIVSGYGVSDVAQEAMGGWFFYGKIDQMRYEMENVIDDLGAAVSEYFAKGTDVRQQLRKYFGSPLDDYVPFGPDVHALQEILGRRLDHRNTSIRLLVGHSKGNLLISDVLNYFRTALQDGPGSDNLAFRNLAVVTLGAVVDISKDVIPEENIHQFLGTFDSLGYLNSRSNFGDLAPRTRLPGKWHSLNRHFLGHMDVIELLRKVPIPGPLKPPGTGADPVVVERTNRITASLRAQAQANNVLAVH
jgi:hypothetical protein